MKRFRIKHLTQEADYIMKLETNSQRQRHSYRTRKDLNLRMRILTGYIKNGSIFYIAGTKSGRDVYDE